MGRGDSKRSKKMRRINSQNRLKRRLKKNAALTKETRKKK